MDNMIQVYPNVITLDKCEKLISIFNKLNHEGLGFQSELQYKDSTVRRDTALMLEDHCAEMAALLHRTVLQDKLKEYISTYSGATLSMIGTHVKMQKTMPGGGYHSWHAESTTFNTTQRQLVWLMYLNDVLEGGETEFLNQSVRVQPSAGTLVIWPAAWPWQHRGNPPLAGEKYILTGWWFLRAE